MEPRRGNADAPRSGSRACRGHPGGQCPHVAVVGPAAAAEESPWRSYVGRLDGEVVTTASLAPAVGIGGIYNVATLPKARRQGLGAAMTLTALREARELGCRIGILQSSAIGLGVYRRLGFERYSTYSVYVGTGQN